MYTFTTAKILYTFLFAVLLILVRVTFVDPAPALKRAEGFFQKQMKGVVGVAVGVGAMLISNFVALVVRFVLKKGLSWFSNPFAPLALYGSAALLGEFFSHPHCL